MEKNTDLLASGQGAICATLRTTIHVDRLINRLTHKTSDTASKSETPKFSSVDIPMFSNGRQTWKSWRSLGFVPLLRE